MKRFEEMRQLLKPKRQVGVEGSKCQLCGKWFDPGDAKVWTRETGACHFYPCYLDFVGKADVKAEWEKLTSQK